MNKYIVGKTQKHLAVNEQVHEMVKMFPEILEITARKTHSANHINV